MQTGTDHKHKHHIHIHRRLERLDDASLERLDKIRKHRRLIKASILALKIGVGSGIAVILATLLHLGSPTAAGTITLLTLVNTKKGTLSLIWRRFASFIITVVLCEILFRTGLDPYIAFMVFLVGIVFITEILEWGSTLSVNALIGMHFLTQSTLGFDFILNEFWLLCIGVSIAFILNLFYAYNNMRLHMLACRVSSEKMLVRDLKRMADYLESDADYIKDPGRYLRQTEKENQGYLLMAREYAGNFYSKAPECYEAYFEMRIRQILILRNMSGEIKELKKHPEQAKITAGYIRSILPYVGEINPPASQMEKLAQLVKGMKEEKREDPISFESIAVLYHILLSFRDIMDLKIDFIHSLSREQKNLIFRDIRYES